MGGRGREDIGHRWQNIREEGGDRIRNFTYRAIWTTGNIDNSELLLPDLLLFYNFLLSRVIHMRKPTVAPLQNTGNAEQ